MKIEDEIKQPVFKNQMAKATLNIIFTANWLISNISKTLKPFGISSQQYNVLRILRGGFPSPMMLSDIQGRMLDKMSNATRLVEKLKEKNYLTRKTCPFNHRKVDIIITEQGLHLLEEIEPLIEKINGGFLKGHSEISEMEWTQLNDLLDRLRGNNDE